MNGIVAYDSSDDEASAPPAAAQSSSVGAGSKRRQRSSSPSANSDDDEALDPTDAFGLRSVAKSQQTVEAAPQLPTKSKGKRGAKAAKQDAGRSTSTSTELVLAAPDVPDDVFASSSTALLTRPSDTEMHVNISYEDMTRPELGPVNPFSTRKLGALQNTLSGHVESAAMSDFAFRAQQRTFDTLGYARNPNERAASEYVGDLAAAIKTGGATAVELRAGGKEGKAKAKELKKLRTAAGDTTIVEGEGAYVGPWGGWSGEKIHVTEGMGPSEEDIRIANEKSTNRKKDEEEAKITRQAEEAQGTEKSVFHGKSMYDYQGRTYMHIPTDVDTNLHAEAGTQHCNVPSACIHTWTGHTKGISALRLFPQSGHLLLSGSMDTKIKLWDVYHDGKCLRTYMGHSKAVRDVTFSNDGRRFLSTSYDRQIKLWDTETGACIRAFSNGKLPNVVKFHPDEDKQNIFLVGMGDKKITQWDINTGEVTQDYDQHLGAVNTITWVDENRRFVTTSDDKTMRAWDFDIPVVIKYVADPTMHSMPAVTLHPNGKWLACQSLDNQVLIYAADSFRQNRKKVFKGHAVAGFACEVGFSPDGRFISSGDGEGNLVVWDWKSGRIQKRLRAHKEVVITHAWLPHEKTKIVTGSWDGTIKLWD